jgi:hypothetical protein
MGNIFNEADHGAILTRIKNISDQNQRQWGQMSIEEMLAHCVTQLRLALGEIPSKPQGSFMMRTALGKWIAFSNMPWPKGSNTPVEMNVKKSSIQTWRLEKEIADLFNYLNAVKSADKFSPHPFFGELTQKEWGQLIYKHLDHHLKQFNN